MQNRKFLHDMATPITIIRTLALKQLEELKKISTLDEKTLIRSEKIIENIKKLEDIHAVFKNEIYIRENQN